MIPKTTHEGLEIKPAYFITSRYAGTRTSTTTTSFKNKEELLKYFENAGRHISSSSSWGPPIESIEIFCGPMDLSSVVESQCLQAFRQGMKTLLESNETRVQEIRSALGMPELVENKE